jgi:hypothetical protein
VTASIHHGADAAHHTTNVTAANVSTVSTTVLPVGDESDRAATILAIAVTTRTGAFVDAVSPRHQSTLPRSGGTLPADRWAQPGTFLRRSSVAH